MQRLSGRYVFAMMQIVSCLLAFGMIGCASNARVFYEGTRYSKTNSAAVMTTETIEQLADAGYVKIGMFRSEPTTRGLSVPKKAFQENPQAVLDSIAPENSKELASYYRSLDVEVCRAAANAGGQKIRSEEIKHDYPMFRSDIATKMEQVMAEGLTVQLVTSTKYWSVWKSSKASPGGK